MITGQLSTGREAAGARLPGHREPRGALLRSHRRQRAEAQELRLAGAVVDAVIVGDDEGVAVGVDGEALDLVDDVAVGGGEVGEQVADERSSRRPAARRRARPA